MPVFDTYAKRKRMREKAGQREVYQYDKIPNFLRKQLMLIFEASIGNPDIYITDDNAWCGIASLLEREFPDFPNRNASAGNRCLKVTANSSNLDEWLSVIEVCCRTLNWMCETNIGYSRKINAEISRRQYHTSQRADDALEEINIRFRESGFGYQYENGEIIKIDDQFVHAEIVKPALALLAKRGFEKANDEFMDAHKHYRAGDAKDAIVAANRAFESTLKAICKLKRWQYPEGATAGELVTTVRKNGLFPDYLDKGLNSYVAMMKTGLPGVRNNAGGHGGAPDTPEVPIYMAAYAIHLTAANILLAINAYEKIK